MQKGLPMNHILCCVRLVCGSVIVLGGLSLQFVAAAEPLKVGVFNIDASPPVGSMMMYGKNKETVHPLSCKGVILLGSEQPIVLCAVDWIGIGNDGHKAFRTELAKGAGTTSDRVAIHCMHSHDAPFCDFSIEKMTEKTGAYKEQMDVPFLHDVMSRAGKAVQDAVKTAQPATHVGLGRGVVEKVASNRRVLGPDGKVKHVRWSATKDAEAQAAPEGVIDPVLKSISFWSGDKPLAVLTYYATHPQSYYRVEQATPDFPGMARDQREKATGIPHIHFNGAAGNITAGKYNDGAHENRPILADRVAAGMAKAWDKTEKFPLAAADVAWTTTPVLMPPSPAMKADELQKALDDPASNAQRQVDAARRLIWIKRFQSGDPIDLGCLKVRDAYVLHMPGELFVEYQLAAQAMRPDDFVTMTAYGDYAPGYIGTEISYSQAGYETGPASLVSPAAEQVLIDGLRKLLGSKETGSARLGVEAAALETEYARKKEAEKK